MEGWILTDAKCGECGGPLWRTQTCVTLVGFHSPEGHQHDDNCRTRFYQCDLGHRLMLSKQNACPACDWRGKLTCFCHRGEKVRLWPEEQQREGAGGE